MRDRTFLTSEQQAAAYAPHSVVVTAGAGTGKTHMLAERYLYYLREKHLSPLEIVAVTFTEKAATELRSRIRTLVSQQLPERIDILAELEAAPISTIHALCGRICQEHFQTIGIPADFKVLEDLEASIWLNERLSTAIARLPQQQYRLIPYSLMSEIINKLTDDPYTATKALKTGIVDWQQLIIEVNKAVLSDLMSDRAWQENLMVLRQHRGKAGDKLEINRQQVIEAIATLEAEQNIAALATINQINLRGGSQKNWENDINTVKDALKAIKELTKQAESLSLSITAPRQRYHRFLALVL